MIFRQLFDPDSSTYTYLLGDDATHDALIIDPVLEQLERDLGLVQDLGLCLRYALDTHVHADHVTALGSLRDRARVKTVVSERAGVGCADILVKDGDVLQFGSHSMEVLETPGHTNGCVSYVLGDHEMAFTGDALLIRGCGRTDFQQGDAHQLYRSVHDKLFTLPARTLIYPAHDYKGRTVTSIDEELRLNPRLGAGKSEAEFVSMMRDLSLAHPKRIDVALPLNVRCGLSEVVTGEPDPDRSWAPIEISASGIPEVAPEWVALHHAAVRLVDVREPDEIVGPLGHIERVETIRLVDLPRALIPDARPIVFVCRSGGRSGKAALEAAKLGIPRVASMRGGMTAWCDRHYPIAR